MTAATISKKKTCIHAMLAFLLATATTVSSSNLGSSLRHGISSFIDNTLAISHHQEDNGDDIQENDLPRELQTQAYYYETNETGVRNSYDVAIGNPMKGLMFNPDITKNSFGLNHIPASLITYKIPVDRFMLNDPAVVGEAAAFNFTFLDNKLATAELGGYQVVLRFYYHWRGEDPFLPAYLLSPPYNVTRFLDRDNVTHALYYGDPALRTATRQCIEALARRYDGDRRIFVIQAGFVGFWGEWHSSQCTYNGGSCLPDFVTDEVTQWYGQNFRTTKIQVRQPRHVNAYNLGFGFHDDSFTYMTLNGTYNGGNSQGSQFYFWQIAVNSGTTSFWRNAPMGGEVRPDNKDAFQPTYPAGTLYHQDFMACTQVTHATYMGNSHLWKFGDVTGVELQNARSAHARMGYSFEVDKIGVMISSISTAVVDIDVFIKQTGVAPFYYPLNLSVFCEGMKQTSAPVNVKALNEYGDVSIVSLKFIPSTPSCLNSIQFSLESPYVYPSKSIKWAQGLNGTITVALPTPPLV